MTELLPFTLYPFEEYDSEHLAIKEHVEAGRLPSDTLFRLASIGINELDPGDDRRRLQYRLLTDIINHADNWTNMRSESRVLLSGERPHAVVDVTGGQFEAYRQLDPMYYAIGNLARVIRESRTERGKTATTTPPGYWRGLESYEKRLCVGLARPIWRTIIQRIHPDWLANPENYFPTRTHSFSHSYELSINTVRQRMIGRVVMSDVIISNIYQEAENIGMKGIGPQGKESLRRLLEDEHMELSREVHASPAPNYST